MPLPFRTTMAQHTIVRTMTRLALVALIGGCELLDPGLQVSGESQDSSAPQQVACVYSSPNQWPIRSAPHLGLTQDFGKYRAKEPNGDYHTGMDIGVPVGTKIHAVGSGRATVVQEGSGRGLGNVVLIDHGNNQHSLYAHLSEEILVAERGCVIAGQLIARSGNTGASTGPHLHFEIKSTGTLGDNRNRLPGYSAGDPSAVGYRDPLSVIEQFKSVQPSRIIAVVPAGDAASMRWGPGKDYPSGAGWVVKTGEHYRLMATYQRTGPPDPSCSGGWNQLRNVDPSRPLMRGVEPLVWDAWVCAGQNGVNWFSESGDVPVPSVPATSLNASPTSIMVGQSTILTWTSSNTTSCSGTWTSGTLATNGSVTVQPSTTTTYTITCSNGTQNASAITTVTVTALPVAPAVIRILSNRPSNWTLSPGGATGSGATGSHTVVASTGGTSYTLTPSSQAGYTFAVSNSDGGGSSLVIFPGQSKEFTVAYTQVPGPTVSLTAAPTTITAGQSATLSWSSANASQCSGSWTGAALAVSGSAVVQASQTTTYSIVCATASQSANASATVTVVQPAPQAPVIQSVTPNPVMGSAVPQAFSIEGSGFVSGATVTLRDLRTGEVFPNRPISTLTSTRIVVNPVFSIAAATWTVQIINPGNQASSQFSFTVLAPAPVTGTLRVTANRPTSWTISPGNVAGTGTTGQYVVTPASTGTSYTLFPAPMAGYLATVVTSDGPGASLTLRAGETKDFTVSYTAGPSPTATLTAAAQSVNAGQSTTLNWTSTNVSGCVGSWTGAALPVSGNAIVQPSQTTTYSLTCSGQIQSATASVTVTVTAPAPAITSVSPNPVTGSTNSQPFTINGSGFQPGTSVTLRDLRTGEVFPNRPISSLTSTRIIINPNFTTAAATWTVQVTNPDGKSSSQFSFQVVAPALPAPGISSVSPNPVTGSNSSQPFTINGSWFQAGATVTLRDLRTGEVFPNRPISSLTGTQIRINPNFTTMAATWTVQVINPDGKSSSQFAFEVRKP